MFVNVVWNAVFENHEEEENRTSGDRQGDEVGAPDGRCIASLPLFRKT